MLSAEFRHPAQQYTIGTKKAAIWPGHKQSEKQETYSQSDHQKWSIHTEDTNKWVIAANNKICAGGSVKHSQPQIEVWNHPEAPLNCNWKLYRFMNYNILNCTQGASTGAESPSGKERKYKGYDKKQQCHNRYTVIRICQGESDILNSAN